VKKLKYVLFLEPNGKEIIEEAEMLGPSIFICLFIIAMKMRSSSRLITFYLVLFIGNLLIHTLTNLLTTKENSSKTYPSIGLYKLVSLLGYCQLPIILFSYVSVLFTLKSLLGMLLSLIIVILCSYSATKLLSYYLRIKDKDILVFYPIFVYYSFYIVLLL
jgi:protein YIPF5/7